MTGERSNAMAVVKKHGELTASFDRRDPVLMIMARASYNSTGVPVMARFDTGATVSCVSKETIDLISAPVFETGILRSATSEVSVNKHILVLDFNDQMRVGGILVYAADLSHLDGVDFIIGMDIISLGDLSVRKDGTFSFKI